MRFDCVGYVECLGFPMTDSDYFVITRVQNYYSAVVAHRLCLSRRKQKQSELVIGRETTMSPVEERTRH